MKNSIGYCAALLLLMISCRKDELQVEPIGEKVPWEGPTQSMAQVLDSSSLTLFKAAWKRSHMEQLLADKAIRYYTLFAPTDAAMSVAGWNLAAINNAPVEDLDTLLFFHTTAVPVQPDHLEQAVGNIKITTLLQREFLDVNAWPYKFTYSFFLGLHGKDMLVNGKAVSEGMVAGVATNGVLYAIDTVLTPPTKDVYYTLLEDGRFSLYLEACRISDSMYMNHWDVAAFERYQNIKRLTMDPQLGGGLVSGGTRIVPTNTAFQRAGFNSAEEIRQYIERAPLPDPDWSGPVVIVAMTNMDSLLKPGQILGNLGSVGLYESVFFSNDMKDNKGLSGLVMLPAGNDMFAQNSYVDMEFIYQDPVIKVRRLRSQRQPMELIAQDIRALNGVIHVVDDGLFPQ